MAFNPSFHPRGGVIVVRLAIMVSLVVTFFAIPRFTASANVAHAKGPFTIGVSNDLIGNGWREEMICSVRAEARASGVVTSVTPVENQLDTAKQISQIRDLISKRVNAIIIDPPDPSSLNGVIQQAVSRGIVVVIVDQLVTSSVPYQAENNQFAYGYRGMQWLAQQLHGHGNIVILRGIAGVSADTDRENGIKSVLKNYPGIHVLKETFTNWQYANAGSQMLTLLRAYKHIDGVWTSGVDYTAVNSFETANRKFVPIVGADNKGFVHQLVTLRSAGLVGAVVTNPPPIGGVGAAIAIKVLKGGSAPKIIKLRPDVWDNVHQFSILKAHDLAGVPPTFSVDWNVPPYTHYSLKQILACK